MIRRAAIAITCVSTLALSSCGGKAPSSNGSDDSGSSASSTKIGIFVDNAFGDGDFFDQAAKAKEVLTKDGATVKTYEGQLQAQNFEPLLQDAADANEIVFVMGFEAIDALTKVAEQNPDTTFVFLDADLKDPNVASAVFRTAEGCFMAGALAAEVNKAKSAKSAGFVGGVNAPVVESCESGYKQGVAKVDSAQTVATNYAGSFVDPAKGKEAAIALKGQGAYAIFAYAGLTGSGVFDAAKSGQEIAPIGVVADKSSLAPGKTPGSLEMGVDAVIEKLTKEFKDGDLKKGSTQEYGFKEGGWKMTYDEKLVPAESVAALEALQQQIVDGILKVTG